MIPLLDASGNKIRQLAEESGFADSFGQLITPLTGYSNWGGMFAIDNGGFSRQDPKAWRRILARELPNQSRCLWVSCPDVVADARRTRELFDVFEPVLHTAGWPVALVAQDGIEKEEIPWARLEGVFIGGSTEWKMGPGAAGVIRAALWLEKFVHVGRINTGERWKHFEKMGCHTFDGSALVRPYPGHDGQRRSIASARQQSLNRGTSPAPVADATGCEMESAPIAESGSPLR
jgi:hypothetical protein